LRRAPRENSVLASREGRLASRKDSRTSLTASTPSALHIHHSTLTLRFPAPAPDLRIDGRSFFDLRITTLMDLRARSREDREAASVWSRGGAVAGVPADAPS
jgi:hypothetical protein